MRTSPEDLDSPGVAERGFVDSVRGLVGAGLALASNTARLAACEARVVVRRAAVRVIALAASVIVAALGALLLLGGVAALAAEGLGLPLWAGLLAIGAVVTAAGAYVAWRAYRALGSVDLGFHGTLAEIEADAASLRARRGAGSA